LVKLGNNYEKLEKFVGTVIAPFEATTYSSVLLFITRLLLLLWYLQMITVLQPWSM